MVTHLIGKAMQFAVERHADQRYGRKPYHVHLIDVVEVLRRFVDWDDLPQEFVDAAWLHDTVEDTATTREQIDALFGPRVAELVHAVTNEQGANRKERHMRTYPKIRDTDGAIIIKLADRIANVEQTISHDRFGRPPQRLFSMYDKEFEDFYEELRFKCKNTTHELAEGMMWEYLSELMERGREKAQKLKALKTFRGEI